jgi:hypothetical protein
VELVCGPLRVTSVRRSHAGKEPREYLRITLRGYHAAADVRTVDELATLLAKRGIALSELVEHDQAQLR